ncbi:hypothetical protein XAB3213_750005 [Xanthomonas citri pv. bilvae]|nr:hypothetical protein XAB3213_750005 [Xanthomonas citri pv. bilvae]
MRLLAALDDATLKGRTAALPAGDPLYNFAGRALISRGLALPRAFERDAQWGFDTSKRPPAERDGYRPPVKLAVLLPITGNLATAAAPVRDGLLAGYYAETRRRPEVQFFDTAGTAAGANAAYDKAVSAGVDYVVGPLGRDEVSALFARGQLAVPVLALNRPSDNKAPPTGSAGFSLAPEDDGIMAAEYLLSRERRNVLIVGTSDDNGKRTIKAFRDRFSERGGTVAGSISVADAPGDIGAQLRNYGTADAVFLAVRGNTARALAPQLALAGFAGKSRVGTSQLVAGTGKVEDDLALDGIVYPSETWTALGVSGLPAVSQVASTLPSARGPAARLFAFGYDAWKITAYLEKLATGTDGGLRGATRHPAPGRLRQCAAHAGLVHLQRWPPDADRRRPLSHAGGASAAWCGGRGGRTRVAGAGRATAGGRQRQLPRRRTGSGDARWAIAGVCGSALSARRPLRRRCGIGGLAQASQVGAGRAVVSWRSPGPGGAAVPLRCSRCQRRTAGIALDPRRIPRRRLLTTTERSRQRFPCQPS